MKKPFYLKSCILSVILLTVTFLLSGSVIPFQSDEKSSSNLRDKKIDLLEKLENGIAVNPDDISSLFDQQVPDRELFNPVGEAFDETIRNLESVMEELKCNLERIRDSEVIAETIEKLRKESEQFRMDLEKLWEEMDNLR